MQYLWVGIGGFFGAISRYSIGRLLIGHWPGFPLATLLVNVIGSFLIGLVMFLLVLKGNSGDTLRLVLVIGFLGAFTTFSSFSLETLGLLQQGAISRAVLNVLLNLVLCLVAVIAGSALARQLVS